MNYSQPQGGILSTLSSVWEGTKKAVSSVLPGQETPAYNGQIAGRRRKSSKSRKTRKTRRGGQPDVAPPMPERPPQLVRRAEEADYVPIPEPPAEAGVGIASNVGKGRRYRKARKTRKYGRKYY